MRDTVVGIFLGLIITIVFALVEVWKMSANALLFLLGITTFLLIIVLLWRPFLKYLFNHNFGLWLKINQINAPPDPEELKNKMIELKIKQGVKHKQNKSK
jgi:hypothetical protein